MSPEELRAEYEKRKNEIKTRLREFQRLWETRDEQRMLEELVFCLLTPQSKAKICWQAVERLKEKGLLDLPDTEKIEQELTGVRFRHNKAQRIQRAVSLLRGKIAKVLAGFSTPEEARKWLVKHVKGLGYKEASHFLRNIGYSSELAILDRHVLKNLKKHGVISRIAPLTPKRYLEIEQQMKKFAKQVGISMGELDLLFWSMETGEVFK